MPDNRELATLLWLSVFLCWVLSKPELRSGLGGVLRSFFHPFICLSLLAMAGYMALEVWAGARLGIWNSELLKPTLLWAVLSGGVMFFESNKAARDSRWRSASSIARKRNGILQTIRCCASWRASSKKCEIPQANSDQRYRDRGSCNRRHVERNHRLTNCQGTVDFRRL
jgi:hypothetical protein